MADLLTLAGEEAETGEGADAPAAVPNLGARAGGPGRPPGAINKKSAMLQKLYAARGFKDPINWMGELLSNAPVELWQWLRTEHFRIAGTMEGAPSLADVLDLQRKIAVDVAPYLHGKMPIRIDHGDQRLPVLIIRQDTDQVQLRRERAAMSVGGPIVEGEMAELSQSEGDDAG